SAGTNSYRMARHLGLVAAALMLTAASVTPGASASAAAPPESITVDASWFGNGVATTPLASGQIELAVVSSLPSTVTGENARVEVRGLQPGDTLQVQRDGTDVTSSLVPVSAKPGVVDGVVSGLRVGTNHLTATATGPAGTRRARLEVTDHPVTGPVLSGPHQSPFLCQTEDNKMGKALGPNTSYAPSPAWNRRLIYSFGESCATGYHQGVNAPDNALGQVSPTGNPYDNAFAPFLDLGSQLGKGYMTAHSTLTILGVE